MKQAGEAIEKKVGMIERQQNVLETTKSECESVVEFVKLTSDSACDEEIVTMKKSIEIRLQELADKTKHITLTPTEKANMIVATPSVGQIDRLIKKQGFIAFLDGSDTGATTGKKSTFKFRLIDVHNQPSIGKSTISAEVKSLTGHNLIVPATVNSKIPSVYEVSYTPCKRGRHQLTVRVNSIEMATFMIFVNHPPSSLGTPIRIIKSDSANAWRIALSENGDVYITQYRIECYVHLNCNGSVKHIVKCVDNIAARGIEVDSKTGSVYISGNHKLQKYNSRGELVKEIGSLNCGAQPGKFHEPSDIRFYKNRVYICDSGNGRVQIFDPDLNYVQSFGTKGKDIGQFQWPEDIDFNTEGNAYIVDSQVRCVLLFSPTFQFLKCIGKDYGILPLSIRIHSDYMYISNPYNSVSIYHKSTGETIHRLTPSTINSDGKVQVSYPVGIAIDKDGYVYVCLYKSDCVVVY